MRSTASALVSLGRRRPTAASAAPPDGITRVYVLENEITYLAFPVPSAAMVILGGGYAVPVLELLSWLAGLDVVYWGDIDTHGFAILNRLRHHLPRVRSMLMDQATLLGHRAHWVTEPSPTTVNLDRLDSAESALYADLVVGSYGPSVRLEQERNASASRLSRRPWQTGKSKTRLIQEYLARPGTSAGGTSTGPAARTLVTSCPPPRSGAEQVFRGSPRNRVDGKPRRAREGCGRDPGEGHDIAVEVGLVGIAGLGRHQGGAATGGEAVGRVVEADKLGSALGGEADLRPEPGMQALAAPPGVVRQLPDPDPSQVPHHLSPGVGDLRVNPWACLVSPGERGLRDREPLVPAGRGAQSLLDSRGFPAPQVIEDDNRAA